jgi:hypothetical protein
MDDNDPLIDALRGLGRQPLDPVTSTRHLSAMAGAGRRVARTTRLKVGGVLFVGLLAGGTGLASAGSLPASVQDVAHAALSPVGLDVPKGHGPARYNGPECGTDPTTKLPYRNHGQYVKAHKGDPNAGASRCGKPVRAGTGSPDGTEAPEAPKAPDTPSERGGSHAKHGKPAKGQPATSTTRPATSTTRPATSTTRPATSTTRPGKVPTKSTGTAPATVPPTTSASTTLPTVTSSTPA